MMMELLLGAGLLAFLGLIFGAGLYVASKKFAVDIDPRIEKIEEALPGANCGACGFPGCSGLAAAIVHGGADVTTCPAGGSAAYKKIAEIMGVGVVERPAEKAVVHCAGREVDTRFNYTGPADCGSAALIQDGPKACRFGCLGFGDCAAACPFGAIGMMGAFPRVDEAKCTGCGRCVESCPRGLIAVRPASKSVRVLCKSRDRGKAVSSVCKAGCIACKRCEKVCKFGAMRVVDNLAAIDYAKCTQCGECVKECPTGSIIDARAPRGTDVEPVKAASAGEVPA